MAEGESRTPRDERGLTGHIAHIEIDWPRSLGFFGGLGAAVALDLVPIPIALFVGSVPFLKLLNRPDAKKPQRFFSHVVDGAAKPVGGDSEGTIRYSPQRGRAPAPKAKRTARRVTRRAQSASGSRGGRSK